MQSRFGAGCCCSGGVLHRNLTFMVQVCGLDHTTMTVTIVAVLPGTYTQTITGPSPITFGGVPIGEYTYTITTCSGFVITGTTAPATDIYSFTRDAPAGRHCGCCGDDYFFPNSLTVSDGTGSCTLNFTGGLTANSCGQTADVYTGSKVVTGFPGQCWTPGFGLSRGVCTPNTVDLTIFYSVGCSVSSGGMVTWSGSRRWSVNASPNTCDNTGLVTPQTQGICCYSSGGFNIVITGGGSTSKVADLQPSACGAIDFTLDVTDAPDAGDANPACHPALGNTLTVTE